MSRDLSSWFPLATSDPVPGEPATVRAAGEEYQRVAGQIAAAAEELRAIGGSLSQRSDAVEEVEAKATRLADTIERAHGRYAAAGVALVGYADGLARAQEMSLRALAQARVAVQAQANAERDLRYYRVRELSAPTPQAARRYAGEVARARVEMARADWQLDDARGLVDQARAVRDDAAEVARAGIRAVVGSDDLHDTVWQDIGGGVQEVGLAVWNGLDEAAALIGVLALVLCWVPGANAALAALATIAGAIVLVRDGVNLATGNGSWQEFGISALAVVTFGVGRVAGQGLRMATNSTRAGMGLRTVGAADEAVDAARATVRATANAADEVAPALRAGVEQARVGGIVRSGELWGVLRPSVVVRDLAGDLRGGVQMLRAPGLYAGRAPGLHVSRPVAEVANPFAEARTALRATWAQSRTAAVLQAVGNEGAARDAAFLAQYGGPGTGWLWSTGATQVAEGILAADDVYDLVTR